MKARTAAGIALGLMVLTTALPLGTSGQTVPGCPEAELTLTAANSTSPIEPIKEIRSIRVDYTYSAPAHAWSHQPIEIRFDVQEVPDWAAVTQSISSAFVEIEPAGPTEEHGTFEIHINLNRDTPSYADTIFQVRGESDEGTCIASTVGTSDVEFTTGFIEQWHAMMARISFRASVDEAVFPEMTVSNNGNGAIEVFLDPTEPPKKGTLNLPEGMLTVDPAEERIHGFEYIPEETGKHNVSVLVTGRSVDDPDIELEPRVLHFVVQTAGIFESPAPPMPVLVLALVVLSLLLHRRWL